MGHRPRCHLHHHGCAAPPRSCPLHSICYACRMRWSAQPSRPTQEAGRGHRHWGEALLLRHCIVLPLHRVLPPAGYCHGAVAPTIKQQHPTTATGIAAVLETTPQTSQATSAAACTTTAGQRAAAPPLTADQIQPPSSAACQPPHSPASASALLLLRSHLPCAPGSSSA